MHLLKRFGKEKKTSSILLFCNRMWARQERQTCLYFSTLTPSNWLSRTRLVPTRILNSCRSFSLFSLSRLWPWCCILTHNLFISAKFRRTKSMESLISPVNSSESLWSKGWTSLTHPNFRKHIKNAGKKCKKNGCFVFGFYETLQDTSDTSLGRHITFLQRSTTNLHSDLKF